MQDKMSLGKYGISYQNYLKEYKTEFYQYLKKNGTLLNYCYEREQKLDQLYEIIDEQLREINPRPKTDKFVELAQYENGIANMVHEVVIYTVFYSPFQHPNFT